MGIAHGSTCLHDVPRCRPKKYENLSIFWHAKIVHQTQSSIQRMDKACLRAFRKGASNSIGSCRLASEPRVDLVKQVIHRGMVRQPDLELNITVQTLMVQVQKKAVAERSVATGPSDVDARDRQRGRLFFAFFAFFTHRPHKDAPPDPVRVGVPRCETFK